MNEQDDWGRPVQLLEDEYADVENSCVIKIKGFVVSVAQTVDGIQIEVFDPAYPCYAGPVLAAAKVLDYQLTAGERQEDA